MRILYIGAALLCGVIGAPASAGSPEGAGKSCPGYDEASAKLQQAFQSAASLSPAQSAIESLERKADEAERSCTKEEIKPLHALLAAAQSIQNHPRLENKPESAQAYVREILPVAKELGLGEAEARQAAKAYLALKAPLNGGNLEPGMGEAPSKEVEAEMRNASARLSHGSAQVQNRLEKFGFETKQAQNPGFGAASPALSVDAVAGPQNATGFKPGPTPSRGLDASALATQAAGAAAGGSQPSLRERAAGWLKSKGSELIKSADQEGENGASGFRKIAKEGLGVASMAAGQVADKAPEWAKKGAEFGKRLASGDLDAYKEAAVGAGKFVKGAVVGIYESGKGAVADWAAFGTDHTTTYQGLKATAKSVAFLGSFVVPEQGAAAAIAKTGLADVAEAVGKGAVAQAGKSAGREAAIEASAAAAAAARKAASGEMRWTAVERADAAAVGAKKVAADIAEHTQGGAKWFEKGLVAEAKPMAGMPAAARASSEELKNQYAELAQRSLSETDPVKRSALTQQRQSFFQVLKTAELRESDEFRTIQQLRVPAGDKERLVQHLVETQIHPSFKEQVGSISRSLLEDVPRTPVEQAGIQDLASAQILEGRLLRTKAGGDPVLSSKDAIHKAYVDTLSRNNSLEHVVNETWDSAARQEGKFIKTGGGQFMPRQTRGTCPYHATCNLFNDDIQAGRLETKDVLKQAFEYKKSFAQRAAAPDGKTVLVDNGLEGSQVSELVGKMADKVGKEAVPVAPQDMVAFMRKEGKPLLVSIDTGQGGHVMNVGNPFTKQSNVGTEVVFQTFDTNNPTGTVGYINARTLAQLMKGDALAVVPKDHPLAIQKALAAAAGDAAP